MTTVLDDMNKNKHAITVWLDLSRAFDSVDHNILLNMLERCEIRGMAFNLLKFYLNGRCQSVIGGNEMDVNVKTNS